MCRRQSVKGDLAFTDLAYKVNEARLKSPICVFM